MRFSTIFSAMFGLSSAISLTVDIPANARRCYYAQAHQADANIGISFHVLSGGNFDIDAVISRPDGSIVQKIEKGKEEEIGFVANQVGEYELCFYNEMSTFADKKVDFDFDIGTKYLRAELPQINADADTTTLEQYVNLLEQRATGLIKQVAYYKTRNVRNQSTVKSTENRVFWFCVFEMIAVVGLAIVNVTIVQYFFKGSRKTLV